MQLSVLPHATIYGDVKESDVRKPSVIRKALGISQPSLESGEKAVAEVKPGPLEKPVEYRADLIKASGQVGINKPYRAPIYRSYWECIQGLYRQGILGFYKGNGMRLAHVFLFLQVRLKMQFYFDTEKDIYKRNSFIKDFAAAAIADVFLHPLHLAEARLVLQNRLPNFQSYKSSWSLFISSYREFHRGMSAHVPRNFILALSKINKKMGFRWVQLFFICEHPDLHCAEFGFHFNGLPRPYCLEKTRMPNFGESRDASSKIPKPPSLSCSNVERRRNERTVQRLFRLHSSCKIVWIDVAVEFLLRGLRASGG